MTYTRLLESVEESARERERELREKAEQTIRDIGREAEEQAALLAKRHAEEARRTAAAERNKALYLVNARNKREATRAKEALLSQAFERAERELMAIRSDPAYPAILATLIREAAGSLNDREIRILVDQRDIPLCTPVLGTLPVTAEIVPDLSTAGGVVVTNRAGDVVIANTIESRLERARELLRLDLAVILAGG